MNEVIQLFNFTTHKNENVCHGFENCPKKKIIKKVLPG